MMMQVDARSFDTSIYTQLNKNEKKVYDKYGLES